GSRAHERAEDISATVETRGVAARRARAPQSSKVSQTLVGRGFWKDRAEGLPTVENDKPGNLTEPRYQMPDLAPPPFSGLARPLRRPRPEVDRGRGGASCEATVWLSSHSRNGTSFARSTDASG